MTRFLPIISAMALTGCATLSPTRCEQVLNGLSTASEIVAVLQARGIEPEIAAKIAQAIMLGQISLSAACAASNPPAG